MCLEKKKLFQSFLPHFPVQLWTVTEYERKKKKSEAIGSLGAHMHLCGSCKTNVTLTVNEFNEVNSTKAERV